MKDSIFNFDDLVAFYAQPKDTLNTKTEATKTYKFSISNIELKKSNFYLDDKNVDKETHIKDFSFAIPHIGWDQKEKSNADLKFNFENGGYFQSNLNINPISGEFDALITIRELSLTPFYEYVSEFAAINDFKGGLNAQIKVNGNTNEAIKSLLSGTIEVNDFKMTDTNNKTFLSAKQLNTEIKLIDYFNKNYELTSLSLENSYTFFQLDSISNNFSQIFKLNDPNEGNVSKNSEITSDTIPSKATKPINYTINKLSLNNGVLDYTDNLTGQPFNYNLSSIKIESDSINSKSEWLDIFATMLLNERGTLKSEIGIDPNNFLNSTIDIVVQNFLLQDLNIYTSYYMGHRILKGDMYYFSKSKLTDGQIASENKLIVKNASLENSKGGLYDLPFKICLLLTDR
jgi:hypothetical protein